MKWYKQAMKDRPWDKDAAVVEMPEGVGNITGLRAFDGRLLVETESGTPVIVQPDTLLD